MSNFRTAALDLDCQVPAGPDERRRLPKSVKVETEPAGRMLASWEISALLAACADDPTAAGVRDAAMIALWAVAGPRRAGLEHVSRPT